MRITFEFNDEENHIVKWCLFKCTSVLGCNDGEKDPIGYKHKISISNVWEIPIKFREILTDKIKKEKN